jgi:hypothetical protein
MNPILTQLSITTESKMLLEKELELTRGSVSPPISMLLLVDAFLFFCAY